MISHENTAQCFILISKNRTLFDIDIGWEGIPFTIISNTFICAFLIIILAAIRLRNVWTTVDSKKNADWLHFIFDDRITNDLKASKFKLINRKHRLAYLPPILHDYEQLITDKLDDEFDDTISFYKHITNKSLIDYQPSDSFEELPTLRSDLEFQELTESKINELYSGFSIQTYHSKEEDEEVKHLKSVLYEDYIPQKEVKREETMKTSFSQIISSKTIYTYIKNYLYITDELIIKNKGSDALQYLLFQRYLIYFLIFLTIICLLIILPINLHGINEPDIQKYSKTTVSNLGKGSKLIWIHSLMTLMIVSMGVYVMSHFSKLNRADIQGIDRNTLLIQNIPESKRNTTSLVNYFKDKFKDVKIKRITFIYDIRLLQYMRNNLLIAIEAKKYCYQYRLLFQQRCEVRPYCCGRCGCLGCCSCCPKLDGVLYYAEEKAELESEIPIEAKQLLSKPTGSVFVVFEKKKMAKEVLNAFNSENYFVLLFKSFKYLFVSNSDGMQSHLWRVQFAPFPEDIEWSDIAINNNCQRLWSVLMHSILLFIFLFLTTPSIAVELVLTLAQRTSDLKTLSQFLKPYLLMAMTAILPSLVLVVQYQIPYTTRSALNHALMVKSYFFLVLMVVILPPLNYWTAAVLLDTMLTSNHTQDSQLSWICLFPSENSAFYINYILSSAFVGNIFELLRVSELLSYVVYIFFISRSVAEYESARQKIRFSFPFGTKYAKLLLIFTIIVTYSISSPLVAPAGLFYLVIKHLIDRYNLFYVYNPTQISGSMHATAVLFVHISLLFLLVQISTTLSEYEDNDSVIKPSTLTFFALFIFILMFLFRFFRYLYRSN